MKIGCNFTGGNIKILRTDGDTYYLAPDLRDTEGDWFYWAFSVEGAGGKTLRFVFDGDRVGYFGPAVSTDLRSWRWQRENTDGKTEFSYTFDSDERVYFAHSMLYHPDRFSEFCAAHNIEINTLCMSRKGRDIPYTEAGSGDKTILLTARHHACESTGNYVLEGVLEALLPNIPKGYRVICVPFVDYDGVIDGDQGKNRRPYDHNRDYNSAVPAIYPATGKIREFNNVVFAFDFHSPWHKYGVNDTESIPHPDFTENISIFSALLQNEITDGCYPYHSKNNTPADTEWNVCGTPTMARYFIDKGARLALPVETPYFMSEDVPFSEEKAKNLGRAFVSALHKYIAECL